MSTATTSLELIRDGMIAKLEALTPTLLSADKFRRHVGEVDFSRYCETDPTSAFRVFSVLQDDVEEPPTVSDMDVEHRTATFALLIAYPKAWGRYGGQNERDAQDCIEADRRLIDGRSGIGHNAYSGYPSGQHSALIESSIESGDAVLWSRLQVTVTYYRSVSA